MLRTYNNSYPLNPGVAGRARKNTVGCRTYVYDTSRDMLNPEINECNYLSF